MSKYKRILPYGTPVWVMKLKWPVLTLPLRGSTLAPGHGIKIVKMSKSKNLIQAVLTKESLQRID